MKYLLFLFFSITAQAAEPYRICYFSLNNHKEFDETSRLVAKINQVSPQQVVVQEFQESGGNPEENFRKMVQSGVRCDGLVISGHHTGAYGGLRANGKLRLDFMEKLSCDPQYASWFRNVNALWLEGCRTLGVGEIEAYGTSAAEQAAIDADAHTFRVGAALEADNLPGTYADLNSEFTNTLDQDNPLSSRYLRLFPASKIFGWTRSAPGEETHSEYSLPFHIAQIARSLSDDNEFPPEGPRSERMTTDSAARYAVAMLTALHDFQPGQHHCEELTVNAWLAHGNTSQSPLYAFDNSDLRAFPSLELSADRSLLEARNIDCLLKKAAETKDVALLNQALDTILARPEFLGYSFNTIVDLFTQIEATRDASAQQKQLATTILNRMRGNSVIRNFLREKMTSNLTGLLRKIDYYTFFRRLTNETDAEVEATIQMKALQILQEPANPNLDARSRFLSASFQSTVLASLVKNRLVGPEIFDDLMAGNPNGGLLYALANNTRFYSSPDPRKSRLTLLESIGIHPNADARVLSEVIRTVDLMLEQNLMRASDYARIRTPLYAKFQAARTREAEAVAQAAAAVTPAPAPVAPAAEPSFWDRVWGR